MENMGPRGGGIAGGVIDRGLPQWHVYQASSTLIDIRDCRVVPSGSCFETIADVLSRQFGVTLAAPA
jgi:hypothetical protein